MEPGGEEHGRLGQEVPRAEYLHAGDQGEGGGGGEEGAGHRLVPPDVPATTKGAGRPGVEEVEDPAEHPGDVLGVLGQDREGALQEGREEMGRGRRRVLHQHREGPGKTKTSLRAQYVIIVVIAVVIFISL